MSTLARRNRELTALVEIGKALTSTLSIDEILQLIMERVRQLLQSKNWSLLLVDEETGELVFTLAVSAVGKELQGMRLAKGEGIAGWVAVHGEPLLIADVDQDPRFARHVDRTVSFVTRSVVCVPVKSKDQVFGVMQLINGDADGKFDQADLEILATIADFAAIAIENARNFARIHQLVITDDLSGLYNARHMHELIDYEVDRALRYRSPVSLVFIDLDHFKQVNDRHGHLVGSRMLTEIGQLIKNNLRKVDLAARYGGDEFVLVLPSTDKGGALIATSALREKIKAHRLITDDGQSVGVTASFGIASLPEDAQNKEDLIRMADQVMYEVKAASRDAVRAC